MECAAVGWGAHVDDAGGEGLGEVEGDQRWKEQGFRHAGLESEGCQPRSRQGFGEARQGR